MSQGPPPDWLHPYTGEGGLRGIVEGRSLWATDSDYLNDTSEVLYGRHQLEGGATRMQGELKAAYGGTVVYETARALADASFKPRTYVASLSEMGDTLSQWGFYGDDGRGFALGSTKRARLRCS